MGKPARPGPVCPVTATAMAENGGDRRPEKPFRAGESIAFGRWSPRYKGERKFRSQWPRNRVSFRAQVANRLAEGPLARRAADAAGKRNSEPEW